MLKNLSIIPIFEEQRTLFSLKVDDDDNFALLKIQIPTNPMDGILYQLKWSNCEKSKLNLEDFVQDGVLPVC